MGDAADDLRDRCEQMWLEHNLGWCDGIDECQICREIEANKPKVRIIDESKD